MHISISTFFNTDMYIYIYVTYIYIHIYIYIRPNISGTMADGLMTVLKTMLYDGLFMAAGVRILHMAAK